MRHNDVLSQGRDNFRSGGMSSEAFNTRVMPIFSLGLLMTGAGAWFGKDLPWGVSIGAFAITFIMILTQRMWAYQERGSLNIGIFLAFTVLTGVSMVPLLTWANMTGGVNLIGQALGVTSLTFGSLVGYSMVTKKDFTGIGGFLLVALIGIIVASIVNIFVGGSTFSLIISMVSVVIFSIFVLYDMSMIRRKYDDSSYIVASIALYLDFILLFQNILRIMGIMGNDD